MPNLLNLSETLNLLELAESYSSDLSVISGLSESATCGEKSVGISAAGGTADGPVNLADLSPCADQSICADEISDVRLKTDIEQVGTTVYGLPLYHFRYKTGTDRFEGVMAQDVLEVMPDAVAVGADGYYRVKYAQLGIKMTRA